MSLRILLIDAETPLGEHIALHLREQGWRVDQASNQLDVIDRLEREAYDVAVISGPSLHNQCVEIVKILKQIPLHPEIILLIEAEQLSLAIATQQYGIFDDILVPCEMERLIKLVKHATRKHKRKLLKKWCQDQFAAAGMAELGDQESARDILKHNATRKENKNE